MGAAAAAARRRPRASSQPAEKPFSGFVFKIQANMDPRHRDRIAFFRVCSGRYQPAMKVRHLRIGREMKLGNALTFMANERVASEDAVAGDIIGIHNHGQLQIGDTLTEGEVARRSRAFRISRPSSSASRARATRSRRSSCRRACRSWARKARSRCSSRAHGNTLLLGAVGPLQFEIVAQRLASEYKVDAIYDNGQHLDRALADVSRRHRRGAISSASRRPRWPPTSTATRCSSRRTSTTCR